MKSRFLLRTGLAAAIVLGGLMCGEVSWATSGNWTISQSTTLMQDHYGTIKITASGVTLDCQGHWINYDASVGNAYNCGGGIYTCGIAANWVSTSSAPVTVKNCNVRGAFWYGVAIDHASFPSILNTESQATGGVLVSYGDHPTLNDVRAIGNAGNGIVLQAITQAVWASNVTAYGVHGTGIKVIRCEGTILHASVTYGLGNGVTVQNSFGGEFVGSTIWGNFGNGLAFSDHSGGLVSGNLIRFNEGEGLSFIHSTNVYVRDNTLTSNDEYEPLCDANQDGYLNTWSGNTILHPCGTVPTPH
jgi:hypothetical protein